MSCVESLVRGIDRKKARIAIVGLGYVGLPIALEFVNRGFFVYGVDNNKSRVKSLKKGSSYITDISSARLKTAMSSGRFHPTTEQSVLKESDVIIICVPTPLRKTRVPNISYIIKASQAVAENLRPGQLIVLESTTYPGTTRDVVLPILEKKGLREDEDFFLAFSPERIDPGNKRYTFTRIPKVVGGISIKAGQLTRRLYSKVIDKVVLVSSAETAEVVKLLENTFRIVNIGLINEFAMLCNRLKIDVWEVVEAARTKPFGFMPFYPGPGLGGHCLDGKESVFVKIGSGIETTTIDSFVDRINQDPLSLKKRMKGVEYLKPHSDYKMLTFDLNAKKAVFKPISMLSKRKTENDLFNIITKDNRKIAVTDAHPMFVSSKDKLEVRFARDLEIGDKIPHWRFRKNKGFATSTIKAIERVRGNYVYSAEVEDTHTIVTSYGAIVHNCIPADPLYLSWKARKVGFKTKMIDLASKTNLFMPHYVIHRAGKLLKERGRDLARARILILGVTYKSDVKDLRESPALEIIDSLQKGGAKVSYSDPYVPYLDLHGIKLKNTGLTQANIRRPDLVILTAAHNVFNYRMIAKEAKLILDTRNAFEKAGIRAGHIMKL